MPLSNFTNDQIANQLTSGYANYENSVYSPVGFTEAPHHWNITTGGSLSVNITALAANAQFFANAALQMWSMVTGITFNFVSSGGQIAFFQDGTNSAYETDSYSNGFTTSAEVHISADWIQGPGYNDSGNLNTYSYQTYLHEIGHALGLGHAGNYNGNAIYSTTDGTGNTIQITPSGVNVGANGVRYNDVDGHNQYLNDSWQASLMSYFSQNDNTSVNADFAYVMTPMVADILAVNSFYGATASAHLGNSTYGFNSTFAGSVFDAVAFTGVSYTILDSGGIDTMDYSGYSQAQKIDLNAEAYSDIGGVVGAVTIARGTVVENAIGGSGADVINGNGSNNVLKGGLGADNLDGGAGNDTADYSDKSGVVSVILAGATAATVMVGGIAEDTVKNIENIIGGSGNDSLGGDFGINILNGGNGNDTLDGGAGADQLIGGLGNDTAYYFGSISGVTVNLISGTGVDGDAQGDTLSSLEYVIGSNGGGDKLTGGNGINYLNGMGGDDTIDGGGVSAAVAALDATKQGDSLDGGAGTDTLSYASSAYGTVVLMGYTSATAGIAWNGTTGDVMINFENFQGSNFNDVVQGNAGVNVINGGAGSDSMYGFGGADTFRFDHFDTDVIADFQDNSDIISISKTIAADFSKLTIYGNGTHIMSVVLADNTQIIVQGDGATTVTLSASDFLFV